MRSRWRPEPVPAPHIRPWSSARRGPVLHAEQLMVPGLEGLQQPAPDLTAPNSWRMSRPLQIFGGVLAGECDKAARAAAASSVGVGLSSRRIAAMCSGRYRWPLTRRKPFWASARPAAVHRRHGVHGVDRGRSALRPDAVERPSRVRASPRRARMRAAGWRGSCTTLHRTGSLGCRSRCVWPRTGPSSLRRCGRRRGRPAEEPPGPPPPRRGASSRVEAAALPASWSLKVVQRRPHQRGRFEVGDLLP
jgi:hypothetical protein